MNYKGIVPLPQPGEQRSQQEYRFLYNHSEHGKKVMSECNRRWREEHHEHHKQKNREWWHQKREVQKNCDHEFVKVQREAFGRIGEEYKCTKCGYAVSPRRYIKLMNQNNEDIC